MHRYFGPDRFGFDVKVPDCSSRTTFYPFPNCFRSSVSDNLDMITKFLLPSANIAFFPLYSKDVPHTCVDYRLIWPKYHVVSQGAQFAFNIGRIISWLRCVCDTLIKWSQLIRSTVFTRGSYFGIISSDYVD